MRLLTAAIAQFIFLAWTSTPGSPPPADGCRIGVYEMSDDIVMFEVFLPRSDAHRKFLLHQVIDAEGKVVATQAFSTANGHYRISMIGPFEYDGQYTFSIDGRYQLRFTFEPNG